MKSKYDSNLLLGLILILIGGGLLCKQLGLFHFGWEEIYPVALLLFAAMSIVSVAKGDKGNVFWACFLLVCGLFSFMKNYGLVDAFWSVNLWSILLLAFGLSFFALYAFKPQEWGVLVPGCILSTFGLVAILDDLGINWFTMHEVIEYWPLLLIAVGLGIIASSYSRKRAH
ncbi:MAG TPA: DUF5668 domain-containing protein [bacterium]|mgnify:CR=1 FL=1|nr:DUF5668 domain-containing protein [bacterium]HPR88427.1 DUF5668 domain-containing protein [bacterium]